MSFAIARRLCYYYGVMWSFKDAGTKSLGDLRVLLYRVVEFEIVGPYTLRIRSDDGVERTINFEPALAGEVYGPLRDLALFNQVRIDPEFKNLVWPNDAEFDPADLHDWPEVAEEWGTRAERWRKAKVLPGH